MNDFPSILLVDGNDQRRAWYREALTALPAQLVEARTGAEAAAAAADRSFALILLDVHLPGISAFGTALMLHRGPNVHAPIIFIANGGDFDRKGIRLAYGVGAVDCLTDSPPDAEVLRRKVLVFLDLYRDKLALRTTVQRLELERLALEERYVRLQQALTAPQAGGTRDALTQLPNRAVFADRLDLSLKQAARTLRPFAVGFMDLDGFKAVNDQYGHAAGDELLYGVAHRLVQALRQSDTVARLGGDEFALLLPDVDGPVASDFLREKVHRIVCAPLVLDEAFGGAPVLIRPRASIGIALFPDHACDGDDLLKLADATMYAAKRNGGGVCLCQPDAALSVA